MGGPDRARICAESKLTQFFCQVTEVRRQYEEKIKGLMPAELQKELEDTITSLKAQVRTTLEQVQVRRSQS